MGSPAPVLSPKSKTLDIFVDNQSTGIGLYSSSLPSEYPRLGKRAAVDKELAMWLSLDQDGPYVARFRLGPASRQEEDEWIGRASRPLDLSSGTLGCDALSVSLPPGRYLAEVRCYLPSSMGTYLLRKSPPKNEGLADYWRRTRPGEDYPAWLQADVPPHLDGIADDHGCIDFLVCLLPAKAGTNGTKLKADGTSLWEQRRPAKCPQGIAAGKLWNPRSDQDF